MFRICQGLKRKKMALSNGEKDPGRIFYRSEPNGQLAGTNGS